MSERAGDIRIELVEALEDFGDSIGRERIVGRELFRLWCCRGFASARFGGCWFGSRNLGPCLPNDRFRCTILASVAGGSARGLSAGLEGNILAETSVTSRLIDYGHAPR